MYFPNGLSQHSLRVGDLDRSYLTYLPAGWCSGGPVMLALHGAGSSAGEMVDFCGLNATADQHEFAVVYPNGTGRNETALSWNAGAPHVWSARNNIDDVGFISALLDEVLLALSADEQRVYATGMSNGGLLCFRLACVMPERLAAIAPVSVSMVMEEKVPTLSMPVVHFHGTADDFVPYEGGLGRKSVTKTTFLSVEATMRYWARVNGCTGVVRRELPSAFDDGTEIVQHDHTGGTAKVTFYEIKGGGHTWPGQPCRYSFLGHVTKNLSANCTIWNFFRNCHRPPRD